MTQAWDESIESVSHRLQRWRRRLAIAFTLVALYYGAVVVAVILTGRASVMAMWPLPTEGALLYGALLSVSTAFSAIWVLSGQFLARDLGAQARALREARDVAEAATRAKSVFLASMSHEIRTPMNAVIGMTELLRSTTMTSQQRDYVDTIQVSGDHLLSVINDVLDFSKIEAGHLDLDEEPFDLRRTVEDALDLVAVRASGRPIDLAYVFAADTPEGVVQDNGRVRQVIINYLSNAVKFTHSGEVVVEVSARPLLDDDARQPLRHKRGRNDEDDAATSAMVPAMTPSTAPTMTPSTAPTITPTKAPAVTSAIPPAMTPAHGLGRARDEPSAAIKQPSEGGGPTSGQVEVMIAVRDTGIGIPAGRLDRLFNPFTQVDASTTRAYGGTGLGLAISRSLAEMMGGRAWAESVEGGGSTFYFTFIAQACPPPDRRQTMRPIDLTGLSVLVVDDNETSRRILEAYVASWGMQVDATTEPAQALRWIAGDRSYDAAIVDHRMPGMGGDELARQLAAHDPGLAIVCVSSLGRVPVVNDPFDAFISKPLKPSAVLETLQTLVGHETGSAEHAVTSGESARRGAYDLAILVVEDHVINQRVIRELLSNIGYEAEVVENGITAVEAVARGGYDVVLMDVEMPVMDGLTATRVIRERSSDRVHPYIIAMTANAMSGDRQKCLDAGMDDYVPKPIDIKKLVLALNRAGEAIAAPRNPANTIDVDDGDAVARARRDLGEAGFAEVLAALRRDVPARLTSMQAAWSAGEVKVLTREAHTIKSSARLMGGAALAAACERIESYVGEHGIDDHVEDLIQRAVQQGESFVRRLEVVA